VAKDITRRQRIQLVVVVADGSRGKNGRDAVTVVINLCQSTPRHVQYDRNKIKYRNNCCDILFICILSQVLHWSITSPSLVYHWSSTGLPLVLHWSITGLSATVTKLLTDWLLTNPLILILVGCFGALVHFISSFFCWKCWKTRNDNSKTTKA
jgi:ABC-type branched-subunit amino acid transport system permease subunit